MNALLAKAGSRLARYLSEPRRQDADRDDNAGALAAALKPGNVLLVEGNTRISVAIKYLTQSTWSHATLYIGDALGAAARGEEPKVLLEADIVDGVRAVPLVHVRGACTRASAARSASPPRTCTRSSATRPRASATATT